MAILVISEPWLITDLPHIFAQATATVLLSRILGIATKGLLIILPTGNKTTINTMAKSYQETNDESRLRSQIHVLEMLLNAQIMSANSLSQTLFLQEICGQSILNRMVYKEQPLHLFLNEVDLTSTSSDS